MKLGLLAFPAIGVSLGLVACSEDAATNPNVDSGALNPVEISSSSDFPTVERMGVDGCVAVGMCVQECCVHLAFTCGFV